MHHRRLELRQHADFTKVFLGLHAHASCLGRFGRVRHLSLLEVVRQFEALANSLGILRFLLSDTFLDVLGIVTLQEVSLHFEGVVEISEVLNEVMNCLRFLLFARQRHL